MDRRKFLTLSLASKESVLDIQRTHSGLAPFSGPWTKNEVQHLLKRVLFGSTKADIDHFSGKTLSASLDELLDSSYPLPEPPLNDYTTSNFSDPKVAPGDTWINDPTFDGTLNYWRRQSFKKWWIGQMLNQNRSIREKMTLFWANFFGTETKEIDISHYVYLHHTLLRQHATSNFRQLLKAVTIDPGMLRYLNGYQNIATAPDENYARELQELFSIGKGPGSQFTESDVRNAARVLTGWRLNNSSFSSFFEPNRHDTGNKTFSSFYGGQVINGKSGQNGAQETDELLAMILSKEEVAKNVCRRLYRWFVYYKIDAATEQQVIEPLAAIFRESNYELKPVLRALLESEHFFDPLNQGCLIKSPADHIVSCLREFGVIFPEAFADAYGMLNYINNWFISMNQDLGDPPNVSGWPSYYQEPQFHELWINSDTLPKRNRFTDTLANKGHTRNGHTLRIDAVAFARSLDKPEDPNELLSELLGIIYRVPLSEATRKAIKEQLLLSNQTGDYLWSDAWYSYISNPDQENYLMMNSRLQALLMYLMNLPEYQLS
jgi:uncharacterized protein (DUF1800 family)